MNSYEGLSWVNILSGSSDQKNVREILRGSQFRVSIDKKNYWRGLEGLRVSNEQKLVAEVLMG